MRRISIIDLIIKLLQKWVLLLVLAVAGALLFCGYKYVQFNSINGVPESVEEKLESILEIDKKIAEYEDVAERHAISELNLQSYYFGRVVYSVSGVDRSSNLVDDITRKLRSDEAYKRMSAEMGEDSVIYLKEFVGVWTEVNEVGDVLFYYDYKNDEIEPVERFVRIATPIMEEYGNQVISHYSNSEWELVQSEAFPIDNSNGDVDYLNYAVMAFNESHDKLLKQKSDSISKLSDKERICYKKYYLNEDASYSKKQWIKFGLIGAVSGAFVGAAIVIILYVFAGVVRMPEEVTRDYNVKLLATIDSSSVRGRRFFIIRFLRKLAYRFDNESYMQGVLELVSGDNALMVIEGATSSKYYDYIKSNISNINGITISDYLHKDVEAKIDETSNGVIIIAVMNSTKYCDLEREIEACAKKNIDVLGVVAIA